MKEGPTSACAACYSPVTSMMRAVVGAAQRHQVVGIMGAATRARNDVMEVEKSMMPATGHRATTMMAP